MSQSIANIATSPHIHPQINIEVSSFLSQTSSFSFSSDDICSDHKTPSIWEMYKSSLDERNKTCQPNVLVWFDNSVRDIVSGLQALGLIISFNEQTHYVIIIQHVYFG